AIIRLSNSQRTMDLICTPSWNVYRYRSGLMQQRGKPYVSPYIGVTDNRRLWSWLRMTFRHYWNAIRNIKRLKFTMRPSRLYSMYTKIREEGDWSGSGTKKKRHRKMLNKKCL